MTHESIEAPRDRAACGGVPYAGTTGFEGETRSGWAVIRDTPWHFAGLFASRQAAERRADALGDGYAVREGVGREGTAFFRVTATSARRG